jgi:anti-sigma factor RsiW
MDRTPEMRYMEDVQCRDVVEVVTAYLENTLPPDERDLVEQHLLVCDGCDAYIEQMRQTIEIVGRAESDDLPEQMQKALLAAFRGWTTR